jgi:hypothetical protein
LRLRDDGRGRQLEGAAMILALALVEPLGYGQSEGVEVLAPVVAHARPSRISKRTLQSESITA